MHFNSAHNEALLISNSPVHSSLCLPHDQAPPTSDRASSQAYRGTQRSLMHEVKDGFDKLKETNDELEAKLESVFDGFEMLESGVSKLQKRTTRELAGVTRQIAILTTLIEKLTISATNKTKTPYHGDDDDDDDDEVAARLKRGRLTRNAGTCPARVRAPASRGRSSVPLLFVVHSRRPRSPLFCLSAPPCFVSAGHTPAVDHGMIGRLTPLPADFAEPAGPLLRAPSGEAFKFDGLPDLTEAELADLFGSMKPAASP